MSNKKNKSTEDAIKTLDIATSIGGEAYYPAPIRGKKISLNQKMESFFGVGSIWLTNTNYSCTIPESITQEDERLLRESLRLGIIVEGEVYIPPIDRNKDVLDEYWHLIKNFGLKATDPKSKSIAKVRALFNKGTDRNWTAKEIAKYCIAEEKKGKNREDVLRVLGDLLKYSEGPDTLLEEPTKK